MNTPSHTVLLTGDSDRWRVWSTAGLRGAGFSVDEAQRLGADEAVNAVDRLLELEAALETRFREAVEMLKPALATADATRRGQVNRLLRTLRKSKIPSPEEAPELALRIAELEAAQREIERARREAAVAHEKTVTVVLRELERLTQDPRFREAIIWQNRSLLHRVFDVFAADQARTAQHRRDAELIFSYAQRYHFKNDTIGFFGPVGWATFCEEAFGVRFEQPRELLASRTVRFEIWPILALARAIVDGDPNALVSMCPRLLPFIILDGAKVKSPIHRDVELPSAHAELARACDGRVSAHELARRLVAHGDFPSNEDVYRTLDDLRNKKVIAWQLDLPQRQDPERDLEARLREIADPATRDAALAKVERLNAGRRRVIEARGDNEQLAQALHELDATFTELTGRRATHGEGLMYVGRSILYEDARRSTSVRFGRNVLDQIGPPLALVLESARWLTHRVERVVLNELERLYREAAKRRGSDTVPLLDFWHAAQAMILGSASKLFAKPLAEQSERWRTLLDVRETDTRVERSYAGLRDAARDLFACPSPEWISGRQHSPDIMLAAESVEAIDRGDFFAVLGELHVAKNTLTPYSFVSQHPDVGWLRAAERADIPEMRPRVVPSEFNAPVRTLNGLAEDDLHVETGYTSAPYAEKTLRLNDLVAFESDGKLRLRCGSSGADWSLLEFVSESLHHKFAPSFAMLAPSAHRPRISIDRLVIMRESWRFGVGELTFARASTEEQVFKATREWARRMRLPRRVFVRYPTEPKPVFVDLGNPISVNALSRWVRAHGEEDHLLTMGEMLPDLDQLWLRDADGNRYTSELRVICVDADAAASPRADTTARNARA